MAVSPVQDTYIIAKEATWGTAPGTIDKDLGIITDVSVKKVKEPLGPIRGISQIEVQCNKTGLETGQHDVTFQYQHGRIFEFAIGEASHAETTSDWVHTFSVDTEPKSFTAESGSNISGGDVGETTTGLKIESLELSLELNGIITVGFSARGKAPTKQTTVPAHILSTLCPLTFGNTTLKFNTTANTEVQNMTMTITKSLEDKAGIGSVDLQEIKATTFDVEFNFTVQFSDDTFHDHGITTGNLTQLDFNANNGVALGSGRQALDITLDNITVDDFDVVSSVGNLKTAVLSGRAKVNSWESTDQISSANWF